MVGAFALIVMLRELGFEGFLPQLFARAAVEAEQMAAEILLVPFIWLEAVTRVARDEHAVANDDRAGGARTGEVHLPGNVVARSPFHRQVFLVADSEAAGAAKLDPVTGI